MWPSLISSDGAILDPPQIYCLANDFLVVFLSPNPPLLLLCVLSSDKSRTQRELNAVRMPALLRIQRARVADSGSAAPLPSVMRLQCQT